MITDQEILDIIIDYMKKENKKLKKRLTIARAKEVAYKTLNREDSNAQS